MAIDTRDKRSSAIASRRLPWLRRFTLPVPDAAAEDQGDRQQTAFMYRGIEAGAAELEATMVGPWVNVMELHAGKRLELYTGKRLELIN